VKAIISHDIDHITVTEHLLSDLIVPKFLVRTHLELALGTFNKVKQVPSSFFIGVKKGIGLSYSNELAAVWMTQMINRGCELNVHGISFDNIDLIKAEKDLFHKLCNQEAFGIRMHYVRSDQETLLNLSKAGYKFDTTVHAFENPYKVGEMWEFPFQIMDGWVIENGKKWQSSNLNKAKEITKKQIDKAHKHNLSYLGIDFHDRYFSKSFNTWLEWYMWLVDYLIQNKIEFVNYATAIKELEQVKQKEPKSIKIEH
jgi:hypothetical protein